MSSKAIQHLLNLVSAHKSGRPVGIISVCSANRFVLEAAMRQAKADDTFICIESTAAQVNQFGGYSGMSPARFAAFVRQTAREMDFPDTRILLGGDHLGPEPWKSEPADAAMKKARQLVADCAAAGYAKIHLDAATACRDDDAAAGSPLPAEAAVERSALLCAAAESAASAVQGPSPIYVIGTDVPSPGGISAADIDHRVSDAAEVEYTVEATKRTFAAHGLSRAWKRTVAVVVQTGAEFGPESVAEYDRRRTEKLVDLIERHPRLVYEAHSTDYQTQAALAAMVADHFAILKVGPALTFSLREALTALALIEAEWLAPQRHIESSNLRQVIETVMRADPTHWHRYHSSREFTGRCPFYYSYSDRVRYYWNRSEIIAAVDRLLQNFSRREIPLPLISQYLPQQYDLVRKGRLKPAAGDLIDAKIRAVTAPYSAACRSAEHGESVIGHPSSKIRTSMRSSNNE